MTAGVTKARNAHVGSATSRHLRTGEGGTAGLVAVGCFLQMRAHSSPSAAAASTPAAARATSSCVVTQTIRRPENGSSASSAKAKADFMRGSAAVTIPAPCRTVNGAPVNGLTFGFRRRPGI